MRTLPAGDGVRLVRDVLIPMRDGTSLAADLYVPDDRPAARTCPSSRCRSSWTTSRTARTRSIRAAMRHYLELPRHGYIVARVDIRGTGGSEGDAVDEYVAQEQVDGYDAIEWLAAQPWCDGHVNMMGISYGGFTALQVATLQPPHLTSIIPVDFTDDRYTDDCHYRGGLLRMYYDLGWYGTRMIAWNAMPHRPDRRGGRLRATVWEQHVAEDEPYLLAWLRHQVDGPYWRQGSVADVADRITCPAFLIGGWRDGYPNPPLRLFERLAGPEEAADRPVGPSLSGRGDPRPADRPPARGRPLARPLVPRHRHRDHGRAADRRLHAGGRAAGPGPARDRRASGGPRRSWPPAGAHGADARTSAPAGAWLDDATPATVDGADTLAYDPTVGMTAACGRAACRSGCRATSGRTRRARWSTRRRRSTRR